MYIVPQLQFLFFHTVVSTQPTSRGLYPLIITSRRKSAAAVTLLKAVPEASFASKCKFPRIGAQRYTRHHRSPAVFVPACPTRNIHLSHSNRPRLHSPQVNRITALATATTMADENDQTVSPNKFDDTASGGLGVIEQQKENHIFTILQNIEITEHDAAKTIHQTIHVLHKLKCQAISFCAHDVPVENDVNAGTNENESETPLQLLARTAISTTESLQELIEHVDRSRKKAKKKSSGSAWMALDSVVSSAFKEGSTFPNENNGVGVSEPNEISRSLASLAIGLALSIDYPDVSISKMIASAVLPNDPGQDTMKRKKPAESNKLTSDDNDSDEATKHQAIIHSMARSTVLGLLCLAVDNQSEDGQPKRNSSIDLQIVAKMASGFSVGAMSTQKEDTELSKAVGNVVECVFGRGSTSDYATDNSFVNVDTGEVITKDLVAPALSLVASTRPWGNLKVENLVSCAAEMNLWYSAELLVDAAVETVMGEGKVVMTTHIPKGAITEADSLVTSLPKDSIAHLAAGAIIDIALDYRLYRRADLLASKYYAFGGPTRYADARFLHACDTVTKVVKKRQVQVIDKLIERVDEMVARVSKDLMLTPSTSHGRDQQQYGDDIAIETMSEHIREFSLRRLRASNMHVAAERVAKVWGVQYEQDPMMLEAEAKKRRLTYLQWDDEGCPGNSSDTGSEVPHPLPQPISDPADLLNHFAMLENNGEKTVGFDCEWHDDINFVALLQLSTVTDSLLLDIPALTKTEEGCNSLRATVGKLFTRQVRGVQHVIGFGVKDDIKRLQASPSFGAHWFPQNEKLLHFKDLRHLISEVNPQLGGGKGQHLGLSRACEAFLGKQLDKAEQCSDWLARPLSPEQLEYAVLDAWACAAIHSKILKGMK